MSRIVKYRGLGVPGVDEYTVAMLHFDESVTKDECGNTWTTPVNSPSLSTNGKFGKCLANANVLNADYKLECPNLTFDISKAPLCIDFWTKPYNTSNPYMGAWWFKTNVPNVNFGLRTGPVFNFLYWQNSNNVYAGIDTVFYNASVGNWYHVALVITSTYIKAYVNGVLQITENYSSSVTTLTLDYLMAPYNDLDEVRISYGIERWTGNFTPPTAPYGAKSLITKNIKFYDIPANKPNIALNGQNGSHTYAGLVLPDDFLASDILIHTVDDVKAIAKCKKTPTLTLSQNVVNLYKKGAADDVTYTTDSDGEVSISTSIVPTLTSCSLIGNNIHIGNGSITYDYDDDSPKIGSESFTVTVKVAESREYESISKTFTVNTYRWGALSEHTPAQIQQAARLGIAPMLWSVGDMTSGIKITKWAVERQDGAQDYSVITNTFYAKIIGFNHNSALEGNNTIHFALASTANGTDIAFVGSTWYNKAATYNAQYHKSTAKNNGGWGSSYIRNTVFSTSQVVANSSQGCYYSLFTCIDSAWTNVMAYVTKYTDNVGNKSTAASSVTATSDKLFIPAYYEIFGNISNCNSEEANKQKQYEYFKNHTTRYKHNATSTGSIWWTRSVPTSNNTSFKYVSASGSGGGTSANYSVGVVICFVIS